jgi:hypothetical protein
MQTVETISAGTTKETARRRSAWLVVAVSSIGLFLHFWSLLVNAFGVVLTKLCDQFQWSRGQVSYAFTLATLTAMLIGFGYGAESATIPYLVGRYFGLRSFGEIYSYLFITVPLGGALGVSVMGAGFDRTGSYQLVLLFCGVATVVAALALLRLGSYPVFFRKTFPDEWGL